MKVVADVVVAVAVVVVVVVLVPVAVVFVAVEVVVEVPVAVVTVLVVLVIVVQSVLPQVFGQSVFTRRLEHPYSAAAVVQSASFAGVSAS